MFAIANQVAYNGLMISAVQERDVLSLTPSKWADVPAEGAEGHWIPAEGRKLQEIFKLCQMKVKTSERYS